jgi:osmotically-inducible protein OsmY
MSLKNQFYSTLSVLSLSSMLAGCSTYGKCASGDCTADAQITTTVRAMLDQHPELGAPGSIEVQTRDHIVYLNGFVNDGLQKGIAESVARQTAGVFQVINAIAIEK